MKIDLISLMKQLADKQEMFKNSYGMHSMKTVTDLLKIRTNNTNKLIYPDLLYYSEDIVKNQNVISSLFSKNLYPQLQRIKNQGMSPSFLTAAYNHGYASKLT